MKLLLEWISVEDGLPEDYEPVLLATDKNYSIRGFMLQQEGVFHFFADNGGLVSDLVTHWMPWPPGPAELEAMPPDSYTSS